MPRSRPSTPPRSSRGRKLPAANKKRAPRTREVSARSLRPRKSGDLKGAVRFLLVVVSMALLGFALVFIADGLDRLASRSDDVGAIVDKVLDRLLDRDIPRRAVPPPPTPAKEVARPSTSKASSTGGDAAPVKHTARADDDAPSPEDYAKASSGKVSKAASTPPAPTTSSSAAAKKPAAAPLSAPARAPAGPRDLDALVDKVTRGL